MTPRISRFLDRERPSTPCLVLDLEVVEERYHQLRAALPQATMHYAVKANPQLALLRLLARLGSSFDVASPGEIDMALEAGAPPERSSYGNTIKKRSDIAYAHARGAFDSVAEPGWGTHERRLPASAQQHWHLTVLDPDGTPVYRPTVHYAYCPADAAIASLHELRMRPYRRQPDHRVMGDDIVSGRDELGVLLMGHRYQSWWTGSLLDIDEARKLVPHQNATTLQVAASVMAATRWLSPTPTRVCASPTGCRTGRSGRTPGPTWGRSSPSPCPGPR